MIRTGAIRQAAGLRALRHRNYRLFFVSQAISMVGTWMQQVAQGWLVLKLTNDPFMLGLVATFQFGPVIFLGLFGGVVADHLPKRRILTITQSISMVLAFILFGLTASGLVEVWHVMVLAALLGTANSLDMPARQAFAVEMVGREDVQNAIGLNAALINASRIVGPALAGILIGIFDISIVFLLNGVSYVAVIVGYLAMRDAELRPLPAIVRPTSFRAVVDNLAEGATYVRRTPLVLLAVTVIGFVATFGMNFPIIIPPLADTVLDVGPSGFGFLMAASGAGSLVAALFVAFRSRIGPTPMVVGSLLLGIGLAVLAVSESFPISLGAMFVAGGGAIAVAVTANATIQATVPDHLRGRVMSVYTTLFAGSVPAGGLTSGWLASTFSIQVAAAAGSITSLAIGVGAWYWLRRIRASAAAAAVDVPVAEAPDELPASAATPTIPAPPAPSASPARGGEAPLGMARRQ